ncbi:MAG: DNA-processing protein DprA [Haloechinothrix sp.]
MSGDDLELRLAGAYLLAVAEPPAQALSGFVAEHGPIRAAQRVRDGAVPDAVAEETEARRDTVDTRTQWEQASAFGARLITPDDDEWPQWPLLSLAVAARRNVAGMTGPFALWARGAGRLDTALERAVTIVGSRAATGYGEHTAADWAYSLAGQQVTVVSGAAYGIDASAHRGTLAAEGVTIAVLGCGLDAGYPAGHDSLLRRIADRGLVLSEYPMGTPPARHRFLVRNRLLAALSAGTVVVEAAPRSGARNTAKIARELGKSVMAVPGPVTSRNSAGCHEMVRREQATLVTSAGEVLEAIGQLGVDLAREHERPARATDALTGYALRVHEALQARTGKSVEQLAADSGVPAHKVRAVLPALELEGFTQRCESGWRRIKR